MSPASPAAADTSATTFSGTLSDTATVNATNESAANQNQKASATITINAADVAVAQTADQATVNAGATAGYTITLTNNGKGTASGVTLSDALPAGAGKDVKWTIDTTTGNPNSFVITGTVGSKSFTLAPTTTLAAGASLTVHITGVTSAADVGTLTNAATVNATNEASANQNQKSSASITVNKAGSLIVSLLPLQSNPGAAVTFVANVSGPVNGALTYTWNFGNGTTQSGSFARAQLLLRRRRQLQRNADRHRQLGKFRQARPPTSRFLRRLCRT